MTRLLGAPLQSPCPTDAVTWHSPAVRAPPDCAHTQHTRARPCERFLHLTRSAAAAPAHAAGPQQRSTPPTQCTVTGRRWKPAGLCPLVCGPRQRTGRMPLGASRRCRRRWSGRRPGPAEAQGPGGRHNAPAAAANPDAAAVVTFAGGRIAAPPRAPAVANVAVDPLSTTRRYWWGLVWPCRPAEPPTHV